MKKILVTGGAGYIGSVLTEMLLESGYQVRLVDRLFFGRDLIADLEGNDDLEIRRADIRQLDPSVFEGVEAVIDLAGISNDPACDLDPRITEAINFEGTVRTAQMAKEAGVSRFLYSSSCSVYGAGTGKILDEDSPKSPVSLYAKTKVASEEALTKLNDDDFAVTFLRNATVYGLSYRMRFDLIINIMTLHAYNRRKLFVLGGGKQWRPVVHVRDAARAYIAALEAPRELVAGEAFNVGANDQNYQIQRIAQMVRDVVPHTELEIVPDDPDKRDYHVNFNKIGKVLDFEVKITPYEGIVEIKRALEQGRVEDSIRTQTLNFYKYLLEAERVVREVSLNGSIF